MRHMEASLLLAEVFDRPKPVYLWTEPEVLDFTTHDSGKIVLVGGQRRIEFDVDPEEIKPVMGTLGISVFDKEVASNLIAWNIKSLVSYAKHYAGSVPEITTPIWDLQIIENFLGIAQPKPTSITDAMARIKAASQYKSWKSLYNKLHLPLALDTLPALETYPILDSGERDARYAHYEIEGQQNGRLKCAKRLSKSYLAHTMGADQKAVFKPRGYNLSFMVADIRDCEVIIMQWLSDDPKLKEIMDDDKDLYEEIYRIITNDACTSKVKRDRAKKMFLAVAYGSSSRGLGESLGVSDALAQELRNRILRSFPVCMKWFKDQQELAKEGVATDYFGRPRHFEDRPYVARNFAVQGVAATACLEKLVELKRALDKTPARICFTVHDGYGIVVPDDRIEETAKLVRKVLEAPSVLCPGLTMKVKIEVGATLDKVSTYIPEEF